MADNFTVNQVQSVFGEFVAVHDISITASDDNVQSIFGEFSMVLDEAAGVAAEVATGVEINRRRWNY